MKKICLFLFLCGAYVWGMAQSNSRQSIASVSSPESQLLIKNINLNVNQSTGNGVANIPLYTVQRGNIEVPVSISYNCSGIKVHDIAAWVGAGWNLSAGGKITRIVMDEDDKNGYVGMQGVKTNTIDFSQNITEFNSMCDGTFDSEPDLFYYDLPGLSGMFILDPEGKAYTIPYSNIKITHNNLSDFKITDTDGTIYSFGFEETSVTTLDGVTKSYVTTWNLASIKGIKGDEVTFNYQQSGEQNYTEYDQIQIGDETPENRFKAVKLRPYYLDNITWGDGKLLFSSSIGRSDLGNGRKLDKISIYSYSNVFLKELRFFYSAFPSGRLKLDEIKETSEGYSLPFSRFEYNTATHLPAYESKDFDHWGYFNNKGNANYVRANREVSFPHVIADILTRVYTNLGGYDQYEYEANAIGGISLSGARIKSIKKYDENDNLCNSMQYQYSNGSIFTNNPAPIYDNNLNGTTVYYAYSRFNMNDIGGSNFFYGTVKEIYANGSWKEYNYTTFADYTDIKSYQQHCSGSFGEMIPNADRSLYQNTSQFWKRGLLKSEAWYDRNNTKTKEIVYTYHVDTPAKKEIKGIVPVRTQSVIAEFAYYFTYKWISQPLFLTSTVTTSTDAPTVTQENTYDTDFLSLTSQTTSINDDVYRTDMKFPFSYGNTANNAIGLLFGKNMYETPIERIEYKNGKITGAELFLYKTEKKNRNEDVPVPQKRCELKTTAPLQSSDSQVSYIAAAGQLTYDAKYVTVENFDYYDSRLNLTSLHKEYGHPISLVYGYNASVPIAEIQNAVHSPATTGRNNQVFYIGFEDNADALVTPRAKTGGKIYNRVLSVNLINFKPGEYLLSYWKSTNNGTTWQYTPVTLNVTAATSTYSIGSTSYWIDEVRIHPKDAKMTTSTYLTGVGVTSETDVNGRTTYYEYDPFGRLTRILDDNREKVKECEYYIKGY